MRIKFKHIILFINDHRETIFGLTISCIYILINLLWIWFFRHGGLYDIDESGYLTFSLIDYYALRTGGLINWIRTIEAPGIHAPVTTALTSLAYFIFGPRPMVGLGVIILCGAIVVLGSFYLGSYFGGFRMGALVSILVSTSPIVINYSRDYTFAIPVTAVTVICLLGLLRSNHFENIKWGLIFGVFIGLIPITRTMAVTFLPGLIFAAILSIYTKPENKIRRLTTLMICLLLGILIAAIWLIPNGKYVFQYLYAYGYGNNVEVYAASHQANTVLSNIFSLDNIRYILATIYLPDFIIIIIGLVSIIFIVIELVIKNKWNYVAAKVVHSEMLLLIVFAFGGLIILNSSQNKGTGFLLPLIPALFLISTSALLRVSNSRYWLIFIFSFILLLCIISGLPSISLYSPFAKPLYIDIPYLGRTTVVDGRGNIQMYESAGGYYTNNPCVPIDEEMSKKWIEINFIIADKLTELDGDNNVTAFGFEKYLLNPNSVNLQQILNGRKLLPLTVIELSIKNNNFSKYIEFLMDGNASNAKYLLTTSPETSGDIFPPINRFDMDKAATLAGFRIIDKWSLPDSGYVYLWNRNNK